MNSKNKKFSLAIDGSTNILSVAILDKIKLVKVMHYNNFNQFDEIDDYFININDFFNQEFEIDTLYVGCGPGSFTGIRSIISTALGITISNNHIKSIGINSLAGLAMSVLDEAKNLKINYIISSIDSKKDDLFLQLFKINDIKNKSLPFAAINDIDTVKIEHLHNYILVNKLMLENILFVGCQSEIAKKMINNLNVSRKLKQLPDSWGVGKLASHLISNNISINKTTFAFEKFKPVYVRSPKINKK